MPQGKTRRKDDTWTTEDLTHALKGTRDDLDKKRRGRDDDDRKERRRHRDDVNGDDSHRRQKDDSKRSHKRDEDGYSRSRGQVSRGDFSPEPQVELTEEERERLRQERREKRGGERKSEKKEDPPRKREEKPVDSDDDNVRRRRRDGDDDERRRQHDREHRAADDDEDSRRHKSRETRHREPEDDDHRQLDKDEREWRRQERREKRDKKDDDGRKDKGDHRSKRDRDDKPRDREDRHKDRDREDRRKDRDREDRHKDRDREDRRKDRDREDRHKDRDREERRKDREREDRHKDQDREERRKDRNDRDRGDHRRDKDRDREREERKRREREERDRAEQKRQEEEERRRKGKEPSSAGGGDDYEDDFEDYEDDFEEDEMKEQEGEMEEVLRALDEENARLTSHSHRSNWSDSTDLSDERFRESQEDNQDRADEPVRRERPERVEKPARGHTFINFVSAKQRVMNQSVASKARQRLSDLGKLIQLDTVYYNLFDLPPVREYELYIRSFGRSDTKQAYVQTNEDSCERDVQTEEIEDLDKWTQHPAEDLMGCGGEGITATTGADEKSVATNPELAARVGKFLEQAAQVVSVLIEEERVAEEGETDRRDKASSLQISDGFTSLGSLPFLAGRYVEQACFCPLEPNVFLTLYSKPEQPSPENIMDSYGIICVWSVKEPAFPQKLLMCLSHPTCACFSPSRAALVIAGMYDGSVMLWDLREPSSLHRTVTVKGQEVVTRFPTYNTAGVLEKENHHSPVTSITAVHPTVIRTESDDNTTSDSGSGLSFQLASVEENAVVNLWVVTEIAVPDTAGSEVDLGLAPGGRVKLLCSSAIVLDNPNKNLGSGIPRALDIKLNPSDLNHFFVATDLGQVIHGVRFGSRVYPRVFQPEIESPRKITCINFSPFGEPYFLTGCEDGSVHLYHTSSERPLTSWTAFCEGHPIVTVQWSHSRPAVFFVLAASSTLYMFDLVETGAIPVQSDQIKSGRATSFSGGGDPALVGGSKHQPAHILLSLDNGTTELHTVRAELRQPQPLETDFLAHYLERF